MHLSFSHFYEAPTISLSSSIGNAGSITTLPFSTTAPPLISGCASIGVSVTMAEPFVSATASAAGAEAGAVAVAPAVALGSWKVYLKRSRMFVVSGLPS